MQKHYGCIEIMDNVFVGSNTTILSNVRIGPNAIVAAGSVVTKDIPANSIVGGVPTRVIGAFDELYMNRVNIMINNPYIINESDRSKQCWEMFYKQHPNS